MWQTHDLPITTRVKYCHRLVTWHVESKLVRKRPWNSSILEQWIPCRPLWRRSCCGWVCALVLCLWGRRRKLPKRTKNKCVLNIKRLTQTMWTRELKSYRGKSELWTRYHFYFAFFLDFISILRKKLCKLRVVPWRKLDLYLSHYIRAKGGVGTCWNDV